MTWPTQRCSVVVRQTWFVSQALARMPFAPKPAVSGRQPRVSGGRSIDRRSAKDVIGRLMQLRTSRASSVPEASSISESIADSLQIDQSRSPAPATTTGLQTDRRRFAGRDDVAVKRRRHYRRCSRHDAAERSSITDEGHHRRRAGIGSRDVTRAKSSRCRQRFEITGYCRQHQPTCTPAQRHERWVAQAGLTPDQDAPRVRGPIGIRAKTSKDGGRAAGSMSIDPAGQCRLSTCRGCVTAGEHHANPRRKAVIAVRRAPASLPFLSMNDGHRAQHEAASAALRMQGRLPVAGREACPVDA